MEEGGAERWGWETNKKRNLIHDTQGYPPASIQCMCGVQTHRLTHNIILKITHFGGISHRVENFVF